MEQPKGSVKFYKGVNNAIEGIEEVREKVKSPLLDKENTVAKDKKTERKPTKTGKPKKEKKSKVSNRKPGDGYDISFLYDEESDEIIQKSMVGLGELTPEVEGMFLSRDTIDKTEDELKADAQAKLLELQENVTVHRREDLAKPIETLRIKNKDEMVELMNIMSGGSNVSEQTIRRLEEERERVRFLREEAARRQDLIDLRNKQKEEILEKRRREAEEAERLRLLAEEERRLRELRLAEEERLRRLAAAAEAERLRQLELDALRREANKPKARPTIKDDAKDKIGRDGLEWKPTKIKEGKFSSDESETYSLEEIEKEIGITEGTIL